MASQLLSEELMAVNHKEIDSFSFDGIRTMCRVVKCYDGDTCTLLFKYNDQYVKTSCRLVGIDTPELRNSSDKEKEMAIGAREYLKSLIYEKIVNVQFGRNDKYGRPLATIYLIGNDDMSVNQMMIDNGFAYEYDGGKKKEFD